MTRLFISYSHEDEALRAALDAHLALLKREGVLDVWTDRRIPAGGDVHPTIAQGLEDADIVLLLISQYFNNSEYCASIEMKRALERHAAGQCIAVPVLLRPCDWKTAPYARLNAIPRDNRPVTQWPSQDAAFAEVVEELRELLTRIAAAEARPPLAQPGSPRIALAQPLDREHAVSLRPESRMPAGKRRLAAFAALAVAVSMSAATTLYIFRPTSARLTSPIGSDSPGHPQGQVPPDAPDPKNAAAPIAAPSLVADPVAGGDERAEASRTILTSPTVPVSTSPGGRAHVTGLPRKALGTASTASEECVRLTGLFAKGDLGPNDLTRLKKACNQ